MKRQIQWLLCAVCALGVSGVVSGQDGESVLETWPSRLLSTTVSMGKRFFNVLRAGYGSRVVAEGICRRADQVKNTAEQAQMYELAAREYLEEAEACRDAGRFEREEEALEHFVDCVGQIGDQDEMYELAAEKYWKEAETCGTAEKFEREKKALEHFAYIVRQIGDRVKQAQMYKLAAKKYREEAEACKEPGRKNEALAKYAYFLNQLAISTEDLKTKLDLYKRAAEVLEGLAKRGYECRVLRAFVYYNAGFVGIALARDCGDDAKELELLEKAKSDLDSAKTLCEELLTDAAPEEAARFRSMICDIEKSLRDEEEPEEDTEEEGDDDERDVEERKDTNSSEEGKGVPTDSSATPLVVPVSGQ